MILMEDIIREGNNLLKQKSAEVELPLSKADEDTLVSMAEYIYNSVDEEVSVKYHLRPAVGLAAPQIGVLKQMIAILAPDEDGEEHEMILVNPKLLSYSDELTYLKGGEGCLSVDREVKGLVHRPKRITFSAYFYEDGKLTFKKMRLKGYLAVVFQHEYDHLQGILFPDRINETNPFFVPKNSTPVRFKGEEEDDTVK